MPALKLKERTAGLLHLRIAGEPCALGGRRQAQVEIIVEDRELAKQSDTSPPFGSTCWALFANAAASIRVPQFGQRRPRGSFVNSLIIAPPSSRTMVSLSVRPQSYDSRFASNGAGHRPAASFTRPSECGSGSYSCPQ